ncbi:MAG: hypothetical protein WC121_03550 [Candidatus Kapaibacterium sp.]
MNTLTASKTSKKRLHKQAKSTLDLVNILQEKNSEGLKDEFYVPIILDIITQELDSSDLDFDDPLINYLEEIFCVIFDEFIFKHQNIEHMYDIPNCLNYHRYKYRKKNLSHVSVKIKKLYNLI